jgi:transposase IS200 family protein
VWTPKYRRRVDRKDIRSRIEELFQEIALNHQMEIDRIEVSADHIHVFLLKKPPPVVGELHYYGYGYGYPYPYGYPYYYGGYSYGYPSYYGPGLSFYSSFGFSPFFFNPFFSLNFAFVIG